MSSMVPCWTTSWRRWTVGPLRALTGLAGGTKPVEITVARPDGAPRVLRIRTVARMAGGELVGYQGVVRDITATRELEAQKERLLTALLDELRLSLVRLSDVGAGLESAAARLTPEDLRRIGAEVTDHGRRLASLAQSLSGASELAAATPALDPRPLVLLDVVTAATNATSEAGNLHVEIPEGLRVVADADSLQRVLRAMLVAAHGPAGDPVRVEVEAAAGAELTIAVSTPRPSASEPDLTLERLLVEAMGGRLWYRDEPGGRASFHLALPVPRRRQGDEVIRL